MLIAPCGSLLGLFVYRLVVLNHVLRSGRVIVGHVFATAAGRDGHGGSFYRIFDH
jgi:hypothetical protein